jgi:hypothetical protein
MTTTVRPEELEDAERYLSAQEYELVACTRTVMSPEDEL